MRKQQENNSKFLLKCYSLLFLFLFIFSLNFVSSFGYNSDSTILNMGEFSQGKEILLIQSCGKCSNINITNIRLPDGSFLNINKPMTKNGSMYTYSLNSNYTYQIGTYQVNGIGDENGIDSVWFYELNVGGGDIIFFIIGFLLAFGITFWGLKIKHEWITLAGCFLMLILGIYTSFNGIGIYKNDFTNVISYITLLIGLGLGFETLREITYY